MRSFIVSFVLLAVSVCPFRVGLGFSDSIMRLPFCKRLLGWVLLLVLFGRDYPHNNPRNHCYYAGDYANWNQPDKQKYGGGTQAYVADDSK